MLRFALLGFLSLQSMTGYDLERAIRESLQYMWRAQLSQIYRTLRQLEDDGLVLSTVEPQETRPDRRVYALTADGQKEFEAVRGELVTELDAVRLPFMVRFFFSGGRPAQETVSQLRILRELHLRERDQLGGEVARQIAMAGALYDEGALEPLIWDATRRAGEMHAQTWIDWIDETIARIEALAAQQPPAQRPPATRQP